MSTLKSLKCKVEMISRKNLTHHSCGTSKDFLQICELNNDTRHDLLRSKLILYKEENVANLGRQSTNRNALSNSSAIGIENFHTFWLRYELPRRDDVFSPNIRCK